MISSSLSSEKQSMNLEVYPLRISLLLKGRGRKQYEGTSKHQDCPATGVSGSTSAQASILRTHRYVRADNLAQLMRSSMIQEPQNGLGDSRSAVSVGAELLRIAKCFQSKHIARLFLCGHNSKPSWHCMLSVNLCAVQAFAWPVAPWCCP